LRRGRDLLEIAPKRGETILVPFTRAVVPDVDLAAGRSSKPRDCLTGTRGAAGSSSAMAIRFYSKSETHSELSNFAPFPIEIDGESWPSVEHFYQASKFDDPEMRD
jgi:hypothetical protein